MTDPTLFDLFRIHVDRLFIKPHDIQGKLIHAAMGIAGESGELVDPIKKNWVYGAHLDRGNVVEELGDLLFYMQALMLHTEEPITWKEVISHNIEKLQSRYPTGYTDEAALARADKQ